MSGKEAWWLFRPESVVKTIFGYNPHHPDESTCHMLGCPTCKYRPKNPTDGTLTRRGA